MSSHLSKQAVKLPSQNSPSAAASVTSDMTLADTFVLLCDWHGQVVWKSGGDDRATIGEAIWNGQEFCGLTNCSRSLLRSRLINDVADSLCRDASGVAIAAIAATERRGYSAAVFTRWACRNISSV